MKEFCLFRDELPCWQKSLLEDIILDDDDDGCTELNDVDDLYFQSVKGEILSYSLEKI